MQCIACGEKILRHIFDLRSIIANPNAIYLEKSEAFSVECGDISIQQCLTCGFSYNSSFDPKILDYSNYAISLFGSDSFQKYIDEIATILKKKFNLKNMRILEIGCGDGLFLYTLSKRLNSSGIGYDPSWSKRKEVLEKNYPADFYNYVSIHPEYYSDQSLDENFDMVICRHVIEHIPSPDSFLHSIFNLLIKKNPNCIFMLEVPALEDIVLKNDVSQFIYEHCNYFSKQSLIHILHRAGFNIAKICHTFNGYYTTCFCSPNRISEVNIDDDIPIIKKSFWLKTL